MHPIFILLIAVGIVPFAAFGVREGLRVPRRLIGLPVAPEVRGDAPLSLWQKLYWRLMAWTGMDTALHRELIAFGGLKPGERVMDVGAGTGELALLLKATVGPRGRVAAIDINDAFLHRCRTRAHHFGLEVDFKHGNAAAIPFPDNTFDAVTCSLMAHHLPTDVKVTMLHEIFRVLRPGGRMAFFDITRPTRLDEWWRVLTVLSLDLLFEWHCGAANLRGELMGMIRNAGFEIADERLRHLRGVRAQFVLGRKP